MHHPTDRIAHTTTFVTQVVEHWLEREIAQWVHPMKDRSNDPSHHERRSYHGATSHSFEWPNWPVKIKPRNKSQVHTLKINVLSASLNKTFPSFMKIYIYIYIHMIKIFFRLQCFDRCSKYQSAMLKRT